MRKQSKRIAGQLLTVMLLSLILSACSGNNGSGSNAGNNTPANQSPANSQTASETPAAEQEDDQEPATIRIITWNPPDNPNVKAAYDLFKEMYPHITIIDEMVTEGSDTAVMEKITALQAAGTPADLVWINDATFYLKDGLLEDLSPFVEADPLVKDAPLADGMLDSMKINGKQYGLPRTVASAVVYVNKDLMNKYGLEMPANDWTYDQFREMAKQATDPAVGEYGISESWFNSLYLAAILGVANGSAQNLFFLNEDSSQSVAHTPAALADIRWVQELQTVDGSTPSIPQAQEMGLDFTNNGFLQGKFLFDIEGQWSTASVRDNAKFDWDILPMPRGTSAQVTSQWVAAQGMLAASKNKEAAWKFLSFGFTKEAQQLGVSNGNAPITADPELVEAYKSAEVFAGKNTEALTVTSSMCCVHPGFSTPGWNDYYSAGWYAWGPQVLRNGQDINATIVPEVEKWNQTTAQLRKEIGL